MIGRQLRTILAGTALLGGCATADGPQFTAQTHKPTAGNALVYVYRPSTVIGFANMDVPIMHLDQRRLTRIRIGGALAIQVSPGQHTLSTTESLLGSDTGRIRGETKFSASSGSTLYFRYTETFASISAMPTPVGAVVTSTGNYRFEAVPEAEALTELAGTKPLELDKKSP
jgi:hypothetical protein